MRDPTHPLMRRPEPCIHCRRVHLKTEPCRVTSYCSRCGDVAGIFTPDAAEDRTCWRCLRENAS